MRVQIVHVLICLIIFIVFSYNINLVILKNIIYKSAGILNNKFHLNISYQLSRDVLKGFNGNVANKKCFLLIWNSSRNVGNVEHGDTYGAKYNERIFSDRNPYCNRFITIEKPSGRMGNRMFQIAAVIGAAYLYDLIPVIPNGILRRYVNLPNLYNANYLQNSTYCTCKKTAVFYPCKKSLNSSFNVTMKGLFQSWKYFKTARHIIKRVFRIKREYINDAKQFLENVTTKGFQHICIHVRRGDMLKKAYRNMNVSYANFIHKAMEFYRLKFKNVDFISVSEDKVWCRTNINNVPVSPFKHAGDDMALMILCDHVIVTAGTYGWWGAWLSGGTTVYYKGFPGEFLSHKFVIPDYYPPNWIGLN